jgi:hypothetical protein
MAQIFHFYLFTKSNDMQTDKKEVTGINANAKMPTEKNAGENVAAAHEEAINDIDQDPDFSMHTPNDDLDEGESARLGEDKTDII